MAATSYSTLPSSTHVGFGSQGGSYNSTNHGIYDSGIGSLTSHPYQYETTNYGANHIDNPQQSFYSNDYHQTSYSNVGHPTEQSQHQLKNNSKLHPLKTNDRSKTMTISNAASQGPTKKSRKTPENKNMNDKNGKSKNPQQKPPLGTVQQRSLPPIDDQHHQSHLVRSEHQITNPAPKKQKHKSQPPPQSNLNRSDPKISKAHATPPPLPLIQHHSSSDDQNNRAFDKVSKLNQPSQDLKPTKSSLMRAAANKKSQENRELNRKTKYFPNKLKSQQTSPQTDIEQSDYEKAKRDKNQQLSKTQKSSHSDGEQTDAAKIHRNKKQSHSLPKDRKSRRDNHRTDDNNSSGDENNNHNQHKRHRSKSQKRTTFSDSHLDKHHQLPPLRHSRIGYNYDPHIDYPLPPGHPMRRRYPYNEHPFYGSYPARYDHRHLYEDAEDIPPYLAPYHDPYDPFFDYEKRKVQPKHHQDKSEHHTDHEDNNGGYETDRGDGTKSQLSRKSKHKNTKTNNVGRKSRRDHEERRHPSHWPPDYYSPDYYHGEDALELWRQERNDFLKKKFKPTIHDVLYSQQWMKSDSYLENQRRRALRDAQGYYFPYKKYTLKDYKGMQRLNNPNPYAEIDDTTTIDRRERAKKRQEYGSLVERQMVDNPGTRHVPLREMSPRKPWHLSSGEAHDPNVASKRERAIEYAKVQVKYRPVESLKTDSNKSDPTKHYINNHRYPDWNDDDD